MLVTYTAPEWICGGTQALHVLEQPGDSRNEVVANAARRDIFKEMFANIHFADNTCFNKGDRFTKLRPHLTLLNGRVILYALEQECYNIDESMCQYLGKHGCKQFMRGKTFQFGFKLWCACTPLGCLVTVKPY